MPGRLFLEKNVQFSLISIILFLNTGGVPYRFSSCMGSLVIEHIGKHFTISIITWGNNRAN